MHSTALWDIATVIVGLAGLAILWTAIVREQRSSRRETEGTEESHDPARRREDMIFIWTELHGVPRERAEAMFEEYERAHTAGSLGLRGK